MASIIVHKYRTHCSEKRAPRIPYRSGKQLSLADCDRPFLLALHGNNRWLKPSHCIPPG